jgi:glycosyltransferase involved in cell wall biosynthesis
LGDPLVSIITPIYDVEPYICHYLDSVLNQTYQNLEIICVNDGSPDRCGEILDIYAKKDARLIVIHQGNSGIANATNHGLDKATGEYVGFVDPDDWIELDFVEKAVGVAICEDADIVLTNHFREYRDRSETMMNDNPIPNVFEDNSLAFRYALESDVYKGIKVYLWNKLFRARFFDINANDGLGFRMDEHLSTGSDSLLLSQCILNAKRFAYIPQAFNHHRIRNNSIIRNSNFARRLGVDSAMEQIAILLEKEGFEHDVIALAKRFHTYYSSQLAEFAFAIRDTENLEFSKVLIRKYLKEYIESCLHFPDRLERISTILSLEIKPEEGL